MSDIDPKVRELQRAGLMGRVVAKVKLTNQRDVILSQPGTGPAGQVRRRAVRACVDITSNYVILPTALADQLGFPRVQAPVRGASAREMVELVEVELMGRRGTYRALLEPNCTTVIIGAIVLQDLDLLIDCTNQKLYPRDPNCIIADVE